MRLDDLAEGEAEDGQGQEGDGEVGDEAARIGVAAQAGGDGAEPGPVFPADGENGTGLDDDFEELAALVVETEQVAGEDQMAGRGDGQELGQALDDAEDEGMQQQG